MKKTLKISSIILFNVCLLWLAIAIPALIMASSPTFYYSQFEECGLYEERDEYGAASRHIIPYIGGDQGTQATFSDGQLNEIADHIVNYLFTDMPSFELRMDNVYLLGHGETDGVSLFGPEAVSHMADVKGLIGFSIGASISAGVILVGLIILFILKRRVFWGRLFRVSARFYIALLLFAGIFCLWSYIGASEETPFLLNLWGNMHFIIFAFQPSKYSGSFLLDTLTYVLTLEFFMNAVITIFAVLLITVAIWLVTAKILEKKANNP